MKRLAYYALFVSIVLIASTDLARADHIVFTGHAEGSFGGPFSSTAGIPGLTFTGTNFAFQTDEFGKLFENSNTPTLGQFAITDAAVLFGSCGSAVCNVNFQLALVFDSSVTPNPLIIPAVLRIIPSTQVVAIDFSVSPTIHDFSFTQGIFTGTGGLSVGAPNLRGFPGDGVLTGVLFLSSLDPPHPTPEPVSLLLFGSASVGLYLFKKYR